MPPATTGPAAPELSTLVLDAGAWQVIAAGLPAAWLPEAFSSEWSARATRVQIGAIRERLHVQGLLDAAGSPHPSLAQALSMFAAAPIRIRVRTWGGDRAVIGELAVAPSAAVGLTRLQQIELVPGAGPRVAQDAAGAELSIFEPAGTAQAIWRMMPPAVTQASAGPADSSRVVLGWEDALALSTALRHQQTPGPDESLQVATEVVRVLRDAAGLDQVPDVLSALATSLDGAVRIEISAQGAAPGARTELWIGYWLAGAGRLVSVSPRPGPDPAGTGIDLALAQAGASDVRDDVLLAVTQAFDQMLTAPAERA